MYIALDVIGINTEYQGQVIHQAVSDYFAKHVAESEDTIFLNVEVALDEDIGDVHGLADQEQDDEYTIYINKSILDDEIELYKTVVHECVHVKQYLTKQLEHINLFSTFWEGLEYNSSKIYYKDLPWEIEAFAIEEEMATCYLSNQQ